MHECRLDGTGPHCHCRLGFILAEDRKTCQGKFTGPLSLEQQENASNDFEHVKRAFGLASSPSACLPRRHR